VAAGSLPSLPSARGPFGLVLANTGAADADLVVQRNELSSIPQSFFAGLAVAVAGKSIALLSPFGEPDYVPLRLRGGFGGEDDLQ
jgi:hypothetical protein